MLEKKQDLLYSRFVEVKGINTHMRWTDCRDIAIALEEHHPEVDNVNLRFTDLRSWVIELPSFNDAHDACNEKILETIQMYWIEERE